MRTLAPFALALFTLPAWSQPASLSGFSDQGAFSLYLNEERMARASFTWSPDGRFESSSQLTAGGQTANSSFEMVPDAQGCWTRATLILPDDRRVFERDGSSLKITLSNGGGRGTLPDNLLVFEDHSPALITLALRAYNQAQGGRQTFPVLNFAEGFSRARSYEVALERRETTERPAGSSKLSLTHWVYSLVGSELHVLAGPDHRVYVVWGLPFDMGGAPEQAAVLVREGYEALRPIIPEEPGLSAPKYQVTVQPGVKVPMRDGVLLATDLYLPAGAPKSPVILLRTPYKKEFIEIQARYYARRGYVFAAQDVRGRFASAGQWEPLLHEARDGYDTTEWLAAQPWSSGKVGMIGASYSGWTQWLAAVEHPPHLATIIPNVSPPDPFHNLPFEHGPLWLFALRWVALVESNATGDLTGMAMKKIEDRDYDSLLKPLPVIDLDKSVLGRESPTWRQWMAHTTADTYWNPVMFLDRLKGLRLPVFHQSGWYDGDGVGTKLNYLKLASYGRAIQKLTLGPWGHTDTANRLSNGTDFGATAAIDLQRDYLRWFDHWLKGMDNGILGEPLVSLFVMGSNRWLRGEKYPLPETRFENLYLADGGKLSFTAPAEAQGEDRYTYDPGDPTPGPDTGPGSEKPSGRKDVLVYTTPPFEKPYTFAGPLSAVLFASTSARDTDWFVHLMEVDGEGICTSLWASGAGVLRARYRNSPAKAELLEPGRVYKYTLDLWHTAVTIAPGHRLRIEIASANFPNFSRNLNTGGNNETETRYVTANQVVYRDRSRPSHIVLPAIPERGEASERRASAGQPRTPGRQR